MTVDIHSVGIIGAGPSGLATLFELLHTTRDGKSTVSGKNSGDSAFERIVVFEQNSNVGGVWSTDLSKDSDIPQELLDSEQYHDVHVLKQKNKNIPSSEDLLNSSFDNPIIKDVDTEYRQWNKSPVYPNLYTNVPKKFMRFSYLNNEDDEQSEELKPLLTYTQQHQVFERIADENDLRKHIRFNHEVVKLYKDQRDGKWLIITRSFDSNTGKDKWYQEKFDAVVIASGHYHVPYIPPIKGLSEYIKLHKDTVSIKHAKYFRDPNDYKDKNVVVIGSSISAVDIAQYIYPITKSFYISKNPLHDSPLPWITEAVATFNRVPPISEFIPETKEIKFGDGTILHNINAVIIATGYHVEVPFYDGLSYSYGEGLEKTSGRSRIKHLYQNIFNIDDPTLAVVGTLYSPYLIKAIEAAAIAVSGVFSGAKQLPSKEEQLKWEEQRLERNGDFNFFHKLTPDEVGLEFIPALQPLFPDGRENPIEDDVEDKETFLKGLAICKRTFLEFRNGKLPAEHKFT